MAQSTHWCHVKCGEFTYPHFYWAGFLTVLGFNDTSTLVGHFVSSPREREKR